MNATKFTAILLVVAIFADAKIEDAGWDDDDASDLPKLVKAKKIAVRGRANVVRLQQNDTATVDPGEEVTSPLPPKTSLSPKDPDASCADILLCDSFVPLCKQSVYAGFVNVFCRKTCKLCTTKCFDHNPIQCQIWAEDGSCKSPLLIVFATKVCAKSCNACE